jgi:glycosyltransferase involved in cell wall biosynthesis
MKILSIVTVTFNAADFLESTIQSITPNLNPEIEFIIIDGGSTDGTLGIIRDNLNYIDKWVSEKDDGIYDAMNKGGGLAEGKYIAFMNANDVYLPNSLAQIIPILKTSESDLIYGDVELFLNGKQIGVKRALDIIPNSLPFKMPFCHQSSFVNKSTFLKLQGFNTRYRLVADYDLVLRILRSGPNSYQKIDFPISRFVLGGESGNYKIASKERMFIQLDFHMNMMKIFVYFITWNFTGFCKSLMSKKIEEKMRKTRLKIFKI